MKTILTALLISLALAATATAGPIAIDFSGLGTNTVDITIANNPAGYTTSGIAFHYDDFESGVDSATVSSAGISGTTGGSLIFEFQPNRGLSFDYCLTGVLPPVSDGLYINFSLQGSSVGDILVPATWLDNNGLACGTLNYSGDSFDQAQMFFSADASQFCVENMTRTVPEPTTMVLLGSGLLLAAGRRRTRQSKVQ